MEVHPAGKALLAVGATAAQVRTNLRMWKPKMTVSLGAIKETTQSGSPSPVVDLDYGLLWLQAMLVEDTRLSWETWFRPSPPDFAALA